MARPAASDRAAVGESFRWYRSLVSLQCCNLRASGCTEAIIIPQRGANSMSAHSTMIMDTTTTIDYCPAATDIHLLSFVSYIDENRKPKWSPKRDVHTSPMLPKPPGAISSIVTPLWLSGRLGMLEGSSRLVRHGSNLGNLAVHDYCYH